MMNKKVFALAMIIPLIMCGCSIHGADVVINADGYEGMVLMMDNVVVTAVPIPEEPLYTDTDGSSPPEETESTDITEATEESVQSSSVQTDVTEPKWTETPVSGIMYVNTEGIRSRAEAVLGSDTVNRYGLNQEVVVIAKTDTNYYKVDDGAYIHADYLSSSMIAVTTVMTTPKPPEIRPSETKPNETTPTETVPTVTALPETVPPVTEPLETVPSVTAPTETVPPVTNPPEETTAPSNISIYSAEILKNEEEVYLKGIDVSWAQGNIDWEAVSKSGIDFAIIRAGRGDIDGSGPKEDNYFLQNIREANKYGINVGVYFYSYAWTTDEARTEARLLLKLLQGHTVTYPVVYDLEEGLERSNVTEIAEAFLETIADGGYYPMFYSYRFGLDGYFSKEFKEKYALWVAQRNEPPETDYDYYIWQYSFMGKVDGIKGNVDLDISFRNFPEILRKYGLNHL